MRWGMTHEQTALEQYAMEFEIPKLENAGLILHNPTGALGCSPDSIATDPKTGKMILNDTYIRCTFFNSLFKCEKDY